MALKNKITGEYHKIIDLKDESLVIVYIEKEDIVKEVLIQNYENSGNIVASLYESIKVLPEYEDFEDC